MDNQIDADLKRADLRPDQGGPSEGTMKEGRKSFQRPVERPDSGPTLMERLSSRFRVGGSRPDSRTDTRR